MQRDIRLHCTGICSSKNRIRIQLSVTVGKTSATVWTLFTYISIASFRSYWLAPFILDWGRLISATEYDYFTCEIVNSACQQNLKKNSISKGYNRTALSRTAMSEPHFPDSWMPGQSTVQLSSVRGGMGRASSLSWVISRCGEPAALDLDAITQPR